jgi:ankyrin repeat protein
MDILRDRFISKEFFEYLTPKGMFIALISFPETQEYITSKIDVEVLILAIQNNEIEILKKALDAGFNVNFLKKKILYLLESAIEYNKIEIVMLLLKYGCFMNCEYWTPIHTSTYYNNFEITRLLVETGFKINIDSTNMSKFGFRHPLKNAISRRNLDMIKFLVENGAEIDSDPPLNTNFKHAICINNIDAVKYFIEEGADLKNINDDCLWEMNLFQCALSTGNIEMVKIVVEAAIVSNGSFKLENNIDFKYLELTESNCEIITYLFEKDLIDEKLFKKINM